MSQLNILLITSTIAPKKGTYLLEVTQASERYAQYEKAFRFYLKLVNLGVIDKIVYADNSGHSLAELERIAIENGLDDKFEFFSYTSDVDPKNSRYYLEINLIDRVMQRSSVISEAEGSAVIWKVTGRYIVVNAKQIIESYPQNTDLYMNCRNLPYKTLDFYFIGFRKMSYRRHIGRNLEDFKGIKNGEDILRSKIDSGAFSTLQITSRFTETPRLRGIRGFDGAQYGGLIDATKYYTRKIGNKVFPKIWI